MTNWSFTIPGRAVPWKRPEPKKQGGRRTDAASRTYRQYVAGLAHEAGVTAGDGPCQLEVVVFIPDRRVRDGSNILKQIEDALCKQAGPRTLRDDRLTILVGTACRLGGVDRVNPRVEVHITMVDPASIPGLVSDEAA